MKRIISLILCVILIFPSIYVCAEEEYTFYKVNVDAGEGVKSLKAVVNDGEIYIRTKDFSKITRYCFDDATSSFLVDGQGFEKAFKWVQIDTKNKKIRIKTHELDLGNYYEINDELYLPFSQMLPILNACIYEIKDDVIYIANNKISLAEILYDFDIQDYWFNMSDEFANKDFLAVAFVVPSYIFDTVVDFRFDRLDIFTHSGDFNDYKDIFSEFLADDNLYLEAMAKEPTVLDETADFFSSVNSTSKKLKSIYGWVEKAGKSEIDSKTGGKLLDALKESYDSKELEYDNLKGLNDAWTSGTVSFADVFESLNYAHTYITQVQDNRQMLNSVYKVNKKIYNKETDRRAAKQVYDLYGKKVVTAITKEIVGKLTEDAIKDLISPIAIYEATAKVAGIAINAAIPYDAGDIAKMPLYANIISSASSKYFSYSTETDEETTNLRLSLLLSMISSKKCFEIMKDSSEGAGKNSSYYQSKIEKIDKLIMALYMVEENTEFDSYEHFEDYKNENKNLITKTGILSKLQEYTGSELDNEEMFDETYWMWFKGVTLGSQYVVLFHLDGSLSYYHYNTKEYNTTIYKYENDILTIDGIDYVWKDNEFESIERFETMGGGMNNFHLRPDDDEKSFCRVYNEIKQDELSQNSSEDINNQSEKSISLPYGKYQAKISVYEKERYGYIEIKPNNVFTVDANFNPSDGQLITPLKSEGTYVFKTVEDIFPDGTPTTYQIIIFYINGEEYATFTGPSKDGENIMFGNQWFNYVYIKD